MALTAVVSLSTTVGDGEADYSWNFRAMAVEMARARRRRENRVYRFPAAVNRGFVDCLLPCGVLITLVSGAGEGEKLTGYLAINASPKPAY